MASRHYSNVMTMGRLQACEKPVKVKLECSVLKGNLKLWPCHIEQVIARSLWQGLGLRFSSKYRGG